MRYSVDSIEIFIPTLNRAHYLTYSIESILNQTAGVKKLVILDNASEDNTKEVVGIYADRGVEYVSCTERGFEANFKKVKELATKEYVMIFHDDDILHPRYMELAINELNSGKNISLITTRYTEFFDDNMPIIKDDISTEVVSFDCKKDFANFMYYNELVAMQTAIYRTSDFKKYSIDYSRYGKFFDWPYLVCFAGFGNVILFKDEQMFYVRRHSGQESFNVVSSLTLQQIVNWDKFFYDAMNIASSKLKDYVKFMECYRHFMFGKYDVFLSEQDKRQYSKQDLISLAISTGIGRYQTVDKSICLKEVLEIILITYNRCRHLEKTLAQLFSEDSPVKELQITILDNRSTDGSADIIARYQERYSNITHIRHNRNIGGNANIARAFELAQKEYFWILCDDDFYNWESWDEVAAAITRKEEVICVSKYALRDENSMEDLLLQMTFVPGAIYRSENINTTVMRNIYDNVWNYFPQIVPSIDMINKQEKIYVIKGRDIVSNGLFAVDKEEQADSSYTRGDDKQDLFYAARNFCWHSGFANSLVLLKDKTLAERAIKVARTNPALDVNITEDGVLKWIVSIANTESRSETMNIFWNYYYRCDQETRHKLLKLMFVKSENVETLERLLYVQTKFTKQYNKWLINFVCCFIPKKKNRHHFRSKYSK